MPMKNPCHPGEVAHSYLIDDLGLTVTSAAQALGVSRGALSRLFNGHASMSVDMGYRLSIVLGGSREIWVQMQLAYDLAQKTPRPKGLRRIKAPKRQEAA